MSEDGSPARVGAIILAAGGSRRMGSPKQLLRISGEPLVVRVARAGLASTVWPVVTVLGRDEALIGPLLAKMPLILASNPSWESGMGTSIRAGLRELNRFSTGLDGVLLCLCDQPAFSAGTIAALLQRFSGPDVIVASRYNDVTGAPAVFGRRFFPTLETLGDEEGAQRVIRSHPAAVHAVDLPELAIDLDTPEDVARFIERGGATTAD